MTTREQYDLWLQGKAALPDETQPEAKEPSAAQETWNAFQELQSGMASFVQQGETHTRGRLERLSRPQTEFQRINEVQGVPIDERTGISKMQRFGLGMRRDPAGQQAFLENLYGGGNVRRAQDGSWIVRTVGDQGEFVDRRVNPPGADWGDATEIASYLPEIVGGVAGALATRRPTRMAKWDGFVGFMRDVVGGAAGAFGTGVAKDVGIRASDSQPIQPVEIAKERSALAVLDIITGFGMWGFGRTVNALRSPFSVGRPQAHLEAIQAQKYFAEKYGVEVPLTIYESSGTKAIGRTEMFLEKMLGGEHLTSFRTMKETQLRSLQSRILGEVPPDDALGRAAFMELRKQLDDAARGLGEVQRSVVDQATREISSTISQLSTPQRNLMDAKLGSTIRGRVTHLRDEAKKQSKQLYAAAEAMEGGTGKVLSVGRIADEADDILRNLPTSRRIVKSEALMYDQYGNPFVRSTAAEESRVLTDFVPDSIVGRLKQLKELQGQRMSLSELQQMRTDVYDYIAKGEAVPGLGTHYLSDIGDLLTRTIKQGIDDIPNPSLKAAWTRANEHYKTEVLKFKRRGVAELFIDDITPGHIGDSSVAARYLEGGRGIQADRLRVMREILGPDSDEYRMLKGHIADNLIAPTGANPENLIDGQQAVNLLSLMKHENPEVYLEVFGASGDRLIQAASRIGFARGQTIPDERLRAMLQPGARGQYRELQVLKNEYHQQSLLARNKVLNAIAEDNPAGIAPSEFVDYFIGQGRLEDVQKVMSMLDRAPALKEQVQRKSFEKMLRDAMRPATPSDIAAAARGDPTRLVDVKALKAAIGDPSRLKIWNEIMGQELFDDAISYIALETIGQARDEAFKAAGGIAVGTQVSDMLAGAFGKLIPRYAKNWVASLLLTNKSLRTLAAKMPVDDPGALALLILSPQFARAAVEEFGEGTALNEFYDAIGFSIRQMVGQNMEKFLKEGAHESFGLPEHPQPEYFDRNYYDRLLRGETQE